MAFDMEGFKTEAEPHVKALLALAAKYGIKAIEDVVAETPTKADDLVASIALPIVKELLPKLVDSAKL